MAQISEDRVQETSTTTGTGALTVAGAVPGFRSIGSVMAVGDTAYFGVEGVDGSGIPTGEWEVGFYTYSAANTLTRTQVLRSSNGNAPVSFSAGTKRVFMDLPAQVARWISPPTPSIRPGSFFPGA